MACCGLRAWSPEALERRVAAVEATGLGEGWTDGARGRGPCYRFRDPDGHRFELYYEVERYDPPEHLRPSLKNQPQRYTGRGAAVKRLDHVNVLAADVRASREFAAAGARLPPLRADRARRRLRGGGLAVGVDRRARADLHARRLRRARAPAPPRLLGRHARGVPARRRPLPRQRHPHRGGAVQARDRAGLLPLRDRARRQPHRGHDRRLLRLRPRAADRRVERGRARAGPGLGRADRRELPHLRHAAGRRSARCPLTATRSATWSRTGRSGATPATGRASAPSGTTTG